MVDYYMVCVRFFIQLSIDRLSVNRPQRSALIDLAYLLCVFSSLLVLHFSTEILDAIPSQFIGFTN